MLTMNLEFGSMEDPGLFVVSVSALKPHYSRVQFILANNKVFHLIREHKDLSVFQLKDLLGASKLWRSLIEVDHEFFLWR